MRSCIDFMFLVAVIAPALVSTSRAQEVASLDLTKIEARLDLRRPKAASPMTGGYQGTQYTFRCFDLTDSLGILQTSVQLESTHYQLGDEPTFEARIENAGSTPLRIPFSPHLADLQPKDAAQKFSHSELHLTLWIAGGGKWSTNSGGGLILYGAATHPDTMLTLKPGEWVRVIGQGKLTLEDYAAKLAKSHPTDRIYAETSVYRHESRFTESLSATVAYQECIAQIPRQDAPIELMNP